MTCKHAPGDLACSSHPDNVAREERRRIEERLTETPDAAKYEVLKVVKIGLHLVMKVQYPNCRKCSYEGNKILVYLNVSETDALMWRVIDPHFRDPQATRSHREAPGPSARFPATLMGWDDAVKYAHSKGV